jgi:Rrf2 family iron-sulfur cluster assembly transcriptional regulator
MPLLSKSCIYGLRACMLIASRREQAAFVATRDLASELQLSPCFLTKILRSLTTAGILTSLRGPGGGVALARPPAQVSLLDMLHVLHGPALTRACLLGLPQCHDDGTCPVRNRWAKAHAELQTLFAGVTLQEWMLRAHSIPPGAGLGT